MGDGQDIGDGLAGLFRQYPRHEPLARLALTEPHARTGPKFNARYRAGAFMNRQADLTLENLLASAHGVIVHGLPVSFS